MSENAWIEWSGGECPVAPCAFAEVRFRGNSETVTAPAFHWIDRWSNRWEHWGPVRAEDIIAYRLSGPSA